MRAEKRKKPYTVCIYCGKTVGLRPSGGDWLNAIYPVRHTGKDGQPCAGLYRDVKPANILENR